MMEDEEVVMTPTKRGRTTCIKIEKVKKQAIDPSQVAHKAGGQHSGLVINKQSAGDSDLDTPAQLQLEFKCFLVDHKTGKHVPESRVLKFWFQSDTDYLDKVTGAYEFFKELVKPDRFPRDYVGFIKRVMKQVQETRYRQIKKVDVELVQLEEMEAPPPTPGLPKEDSRPREAIVQEQLLLTLESAYPNILPVDDLANLTSSDQLIVPEQLKMLQGQNLIHEIEPGKFVRHVLDDKTEVKDVKQMKAMQSGSGQKPTVAIITSKYYEKLAVDAMMRDKTTFVRYKTEGESNVYTIGYIGEHKCVSTKLPQIGQGMAAQISSGNTTTRLLGTFIDIEHVLLVGVAGGIPHYTDFYKHVRLGDVVVSSPSEDAPDKKPYSFIYCDKINTDETKGSMSYSLKSWEPRDSVVKQVMEGVRDQYKSNPAECPWERNIQDGQCLLQNQQVNFERPDAATDRLYMNIGGNDVIEVGHPPAPEEIKHWYHPGLSVVRFGPVGSGKPVVTDNALRLDFAARYHCIAFDTEFDQVLESINGNRIDSYAFIRGVCDYLDGTKNVEWQPYAALAAAACMKTVIEKLPPPGSL